MLCILQFFVYSLTLYIHYFLSDPSDSKISNHEEFCLLGHDAFRWMNRSSGPKEHSPSIFNSQTVQES